MHQGHDEFLLHEQPRSRRRRLPEIISFALAGLTLGTAVALTGHYIGSHASARTVDDGRWLKVAVPAPVPLVAAVPEKRARATEQELALRDLAHDESLTLLPPSHETAAAAGNGGSLVQRVARADKGDMLRTPLLSTETVRVAAASAVAFALPEHPANVLPSRGASGEIPRPTSRKVRNLLITASPPVAKIEAGWRLARETRRRILAARKRRLREQACLARAIYFEARSEGERGQMAVAKTILNRVKDPRFPNSICGVVYQGAERRHACQFSFACDGRSDIPTHPRAWARARRIAARAMMGRVKMRELDGVTYYHADYVRPKWAAFKRRVKRIGRHIFYRDG